jgi:hypothetical protein
MHLVFGMGAVLLMLVALGFGAAAFGKRSRLYSIATMVILVVFSALTGVDAPRVGHACPRRGSAFGSESACRFAALGRGAGACSLTRPTYAKRAGLPLTGPAVCFLTSTATIRICATLDQEIKELGTIP